VERTSEHFTKEVCSARRDPPNGVTNVVSNQQRTVGAVCDSDGAAGREALTSC
jgi:hypothetical protein